MNRPAHRHWTAWLACLAILLNLLGTPLSQASMASAGDPLAGFCASPDTDSRVLAQLAAQVEQDLSAPPASAHLDHCPSCCCSSAPLGVHAQPAGAQALQPQPQAPPVSARPLHATPPRLLIGTPPRASPRV